MAVRSPNCGGGSSGANEVPRMVVRSPTCGGDSSGANEVPRMVVRSPNCGGGSSGADKDARGFGLLASRWGPRKLIVPGACP